jgi:hypothetical protein
MIVRALSMFVRALFMFVRALVMIVRALFTCLSVLYTCLPVLYSHVQRFVRALSMFVRALSMLSVLYPCRPCFIHVVRAESMFVFVRALFTVRADLAAPNIRYTSLSASGWMPESQPT